MTKKFKQNISEVSLIYRHKIKACERPKVQQSLDAYRLFRDNWDDLTINLYEEFKILLLDRAGRCMGISTISKGGFTSAIADPRHIFALALKARANSLILAHNHPSQNIEPSHSDKQITAKLVRGGELLDIPVLDHIIVTDKKFLSFSDKGITPF